jgi:tetratricopeptide (TPR) repeat protein
MKRLSRVFALCGLLVVAGEALAASEQAVARNSAGVTLLEQGKLTPAIAEFQKALAADLGYFPARLNLAFAYEKAGRVEDAISAYREAIDAQPGNFFAHNNLGVLYDKKGQHEAAVAELEKALAIEPGNSLASKNLDNSKKNLAAIKQRDSLIDKAEKEAQAKPNDPRAAYKVARLYANYNNKELALQWLGKAVKQGYKNLDDFKADPAFQSLREDREFGLLLQGK